MKKIILLIIIIILISLMGGWKGNLFNPTGQKGQTPTTISSPTPSPTQASPQAPKTFQFDSTTDLKAELEKVNPQVLDSDFDSQ